MDYIDNHKEEAQIFASQHIPEFLNRCKLIASRYEDLNDDKLAAEIYSELLEFCFENNLDYDLEVAEADFKEYIQGLDPRERRLYTEFFNRVTSGMLRLRYQTIKSFY